MNELTQNGPRLVVCIRNDDDPITPEVRKLYEVLPDPRATLHNLVRIIDESGEDYLYPSSYFVSIDLPQAVREALALTA